MPFISQDLFLNFDSTEPSQEYLAPGATILRKFATQYENHLLTELETITTAAPFRHMQTPGGFSMSVSMTNCGDFGWMSDNTGYRYASQDPLSGLTWPPMPKVFFALATEAAATAGYSNFSPDACLINCYQPGVKLGLHQDKDERDLTQPIVSVSLGIPAVFLFGGNKRNDKTRRILLMHGDTVVWGGPSRLSYHGVLTVRENHYPSWGRRRINLTFRKTN